MPLEQTIAYALETKGALPTDAQSPKVEAEEASSPPFPQLSPRRALKQKFGGLTSREGEVARLVTQGKSNRAIADELVVGVSTVEAHITHILSPRTPRLPPGPSTRGLPRDRKMWRT